MRASDEPNVDLLRRKARILESENERLSEKVSELLRENLALKGLATTAIEINLPGLVAQAAGKPSSTTTPKSERLARKGEGAAGKTKEPGHGPTKQPDLELVEERFPSMRPTLCGVCGERLEQWEGKDDVVDVVDRIPAKWIIRRCALEKCRCPEGCSIITADGPKKLIPGGRYTLGVALQSSIEKFVFHLPIERQVRMASLLGMRITSQTLWDQQWALANLLSPLVGRIKRFILGREWLGANLTPFQLIKKGGSVKHQVWQLACPEARYFEMLPAKSALVGRQVFEMMFRFEEGGKPSLKKFCGTAIVDCVFRPSWTLVSRHRERRSPCRSEATSRPSGFSSSSCPAPSSGRVLSRRP